MDQPDQVGRRGTDLPEQPRQAGRIGQVDQPGPDDERFMREALAEARLASAEGEVPIGAVVVHAGQVVARAHNRRELDEDPSAHAEFTAMVAAARALGRWRLTGCTVYVTLEPCLMCAGLMVNARIDRCVYGAADPKGGALGTLYDVNADARLNHAFEVTPGVLADECAAELRVFFGKLRERSGRAGADTGRAEQRQTQEVNRGIDGVANLNAGAKTSPGDGAATWWGNTEERLPDGVPDGASADACRATAQAPQPLPRHGAHSRGAGPRIVLAVDSFKGSASSTDVESWLEEGIRRTLPDAQVTCLPIADGGEGTLEAVRVARDGELRARGVHGPMGEPATARYLLAREDAAAVIETAQAAGISQSPRTNEAALAATTHGVGELILDAVGAGARTVYVGLGGSATSDGGAGALQALGARLLTAAGSPIRPGLIGLRDLASIDLAPARKALAGIEVVALTDVSNPLIGPRGAIRVFGPQKGLGSGRADADGMVALGTCDSWMRAYAARLTAARDSLDGTPLQVARPGSRPRSLAGVPGAGAAGGLGAAFLALGACLIPGVDTVLDLAGFDSRARQADLVITGEGSLDGQTSAGKAPAGVAARAKAVNPHALVIAVCGARADDLDGVYRTGIDLALPILRKPVSLETALAREEARANLVCAGETAARILMTRR